MSDRKLLRIPNTLAVSFFCRWRGLALAIVLSLFSSILHAQSPGQRLETSEDQAQQEKSDRWIETIARHVPALKNEPGDRLPMIMWHSVGFEPLAASELSMLKKRGLCQHLQLNAAMIPAALALQNAGLPVILMEGRTDSWPYSLVDNPDQWAHQLDASFPQPWFGSDDAFEWHGACSHLTAGWTVMEEQTRQTLEKFRDAGVKIDGVWMDFEGDPYPWSHLFNQMQNCRRCRDTLPPEIVNDHNRWRDHSWQLYVRLYDQHLAKAVRDVFPDCLVTNWHVVKSSSENPIRYFVRDTNLPVLDFQFFNATNPIAYASDSVWFNRKLNPESANQQQVDRFFVHELLQQVSGDAVNRRGTDVQCIPWVARVCKIAGDPERVAPLISRTMYREALRHLWLRGIDGMQVFNPPIAGNEEIAWQELQDAVAVYDEMLLDRQGLGDPETMNLAIPGDTKPGILWSGLRGREVAVIRIVALGQTETEISIECWPGQVETFEVSEVGQTFRVQRSQAR